MMIDKHAVSASALALALAACGGTDHSTSPDAHGGDDASVPGDAATPDAGTDAPVGGLLLAPHWLERLPGIGSSTSLTPVGARLAVSSARVGGSGSLVIAPGAAGEVTLVDVAQRPLLWLDASDGTVVGGRVIAERTGAQVGGLHLEHIVTADGDAVLFGGMFTGQVRFFPDAAPQVEQAVVESTTVTAYDPFIARFDASFTPSAFARGTTTGTLGATRFNELTGLVPLAGGARMIAGTRDAPQLAIAGSALPAGTTSYIAQVGATGSAGWVRRNTGAMRGPRLVSAPSGAYVATELDGNVTVFDGDAGAVAVTRATGATLHGIVGRVGATGELAWLRSITSAGARNYLRAHGLADGRLLVAVTFAVASTYAITDPAGTSLASGSADADRTLLVWFAADGSVASTRVLPWGDVDPIERANGDLAAMVHWGADALPAELAALTLPAEVTPTESTVAGLAVLSATGERKSLQVVGINLVEVLAPIDGGLALASEEPAQATRPSYLAGDTGTWAKEPACPAAMVNCLVIAAYAVP